MKLKLKRIVVGIAVLATTTLQVQARVFDSNDEIGQDHQHYSLFNNTTESSRLELETFFDITRTFSSITAVLSDPDDFLVFTAEPDVLPRPVYLISGIRG